MAIRRGIVIWGLSYTLVTGCVPPNHSIGTGGGGTAGTAGATSAGGSNDGGAGDGGASDGGGGDGGTGGDLSTTTTGGTGGGSTGGDGPTGGAGGEGEKDDDWSANEVITVEKTSIVVQAGQTQTACIYCPDHHPVPMAGGYHLTNSAVFVQASYPENWEHPETWKSSAEWQRAGWCGTVHNTSGAAPGGWDLYLACRDDSSIDVSTLDIMKEETTYVLGGGGWLTTTSSCPPDHPIPWAGGFRNEDVENAKIQVLKSLAVSWDPDAWDSVPAGWSWSVRGFNGGGGADSSLSTTLICGNAGHFDAQDDVKHYKSMDIAMSWVEAECPEDHPIPLSGGASTSSTATYVTSSMPLDWEHVAQWEMGLPPKWRANGDNYDQSPQTVDSIVVCRAKRPGETLP